MTSGTVWIHTLIEHLLQRYGQTELDTLHFEMWNEPDIFYWSGPTEEFCKLYDYTEAAIHDVCSSLRFGGSATCGDTEKDGRAAGDVLIILSLISATPNTMPPMWLPPTKISMISQWNWAWIYGLWHGGYV